MLTTLDLRSLPAEELSIAERLALLDDELRANELARLTDEQIAGLQWDWQFWARPDQLPPPAPWSIWVIVQGRGGGKTRTGAEWVRDKARSYGTRPPKGAGMLVGATAADVRDLMVEGPSGILNITPPAERPTYEPSKRLLTWPNGHIAYCRSAEDPEGLRGPSLEWSWCDELAKWTYLDETWENLRFALREGTAPQTAITTTPRPLKLVRRILAGEYPGTVIAPRVSTYRNAANLAPDFLAEMLAMHEGTRRGRQELYAELLEDVEGALWTRDLIDRHRFTARQADTLDLVRVGVGVDPAAESGENADDTGIIAAGKVRGACLCGRATPSRPHYVVTHDATTHATPARWGGAACDLYHGVEADVIVAERNNGGEMVEHVIRSADPSVRVKLVRASKGKRIRAEPISALYEQGRVHHVGAFPELEDQQCTWVPDDPKSPDRLDALVWVLSELSGGLRTGPGRGNVTELARHRIEPRVAG